MRYNRRGIIQVSTDDFIDTALKKIFEVFNMEYNLINSIAESAKNGKTAMINNGNIISYKELKDKIDRACLYMKEETGIKERSLVLLVTPRCVEQIELMLTFFL